MNGGGREVEFCDLTTLFAPKSVCIIGASTDSASISGRPLSILRRHGFPGALFPVNPKYGEIDGVQCYPSVSQIPEVPDVAIIVVKASRVPKLIDECGEKGIRHVIVISSGFEEDSTAMETVDAYRAAVERHNIVVVGPNSEGVWSVPSRAIMTFGSAALRDRIDEGPISVISQSGSIGGSTARSLQTRGLGCRYFISTGNESVASAADYLNFIVSEGGTKVVLLFLEGLNDGGRFLVAADRARKAGIAVVALKAGSSEVGSRAVASHTGKLTSSADVYTDVFDQAGIIEVESIGHLVDAAEVLVAPLLRLPPRSQQLDGRAGVALVAPGATRTVMADMAERLQVPLASFSDETERALAGLVPSYGYAKNPVDVTAQVSTSSMFGEVLELMAGDGATEALVIQWGNRGVQQVDKILEAAQAVRRSAGKPVLIGVLGDRWELDARDRGRFRQAGIGCGATPDEVIQQLGWLYRYRSLGESTAAGAQRLGAASGRSLPGPLNGSTSWDEVMSWLAALGFRVPTSMTVSAEATTAEWRERLDSGSIRWPTVVKAHPESVVHKSDRGLVRLGVPDSTAAVEALMALREKAPDVDRFLVQEHAPAGVEVLVTARRDSDFGPLLTIGIGGTLVEVVRDARHVSLPATRGALEHAIQHTRLAKLLAGVRGAPPADIDALFDAVVALGAVYPSMVDDIEELELNPVIVGSKGNGAWVVDALVQ